MNKEAALNGSRVYFTETETADYLSELGVIFAVRTLSNRRTSGGGIPFVRLGRRIRYRKSDIDAWLDSAPVLSSTSDTRK